MVQPADADLSLEQIQVQDGTKDGTFTSKDPSEAMYGPEVVSIEPPSMSEATVFQLYRGVFVKAADKHSRLWVDLTQMELCCSETDTPAQSSNRLPISDIQETSITDVGDAKVLNVFYIGYGLFPSLRRKNQDTTKETVSVEGLLERTQAMLDFREALEKLREQSDPKRRFIQQRLFQYLWRHRAKTFSEDGLFEAQAILSFNLDPKRGVKYLKEKPMLKDKFKTDADVGEWLASMSSSKKGGIDPSVLGNYFSRVDTMDCFKEFVTHLDFRDSDIVGAMRTLFDTFKPGGESQVVTRILELFSSAYLAQWQESGKDMVPKVVYVDADSVFQIAVSLIMLNTGLHIVTKKVGKKTPQAPMTVEEYIKNVRQLISEEHVPDEALSDWYEKIRSEEIQLQPLPRVAFSELPVQPDIEGWLIVFTGTARYRFWAVLAIQRLYFFSDEDDLDPREPVLQVDMRDVRAYAVSSNKDIEKKFKDDLKPRKGFFQCCSKGSCREGLEPDAALREMYPERAFEICNPRGNGSPDEFLVLLQPEPKPGSPNTVEGKLKKLVLVAETRDLMDKWASLITSGPM